MVQRKTRNGGRSRAVPRLKNILVTSDFSENAKSALQYAIKFVECFGGKLHVIHVVEPAPFTAGMEAVPIALSDKQVAEVARTSLKRLITEEVEPKATAEAVVREGKAYQEIVKAAEELDIDVIIISTHGYTGLKHTLMGSVAERVVRHAPCPVLVVRDKG